MDSNRDLLDNTRQNQSLGESLAASIRYVPLLTALLALGLTIIYAFARSGLLSAPTWQLVAVAGLSLGAGLLHFPVSALAARGRTALAYGLLLVILVLWAFGVVFLWETAWPVALLIAWIAFLAGLSMRFPRSWLGAVALASGLITLVILWFDANPPFERVPVTTNQAALASLLLLASTVLLYVIGTFVVRLFPYRSVQSRLVTAFVLTMAVPVLFTTGISAVSAFSNSQEQFSNSLQAVSSLKRDDLESMIEAITVQMSPLQDGGGKASNLAHVLDPAGLSAETLRLDLSTSATTLRNLIDQYPATQYEETFIMDLRGNVVLSTYKLDEGLNFVDEDWYQQGMRQFHAEMVQFPGKQNISNQFKLVVSAPFYGTGQNDVGGVVVAIVNGDSVLGKLGPVAGLPHASTYLVNPKNQLVAQEAGAPVMVSAWPIVHAILGQLGGSVATYTSSSGRPALGYVAWDRNVNAAIVAEIPSTEVYNRALANLLVTALVGIFAVVIAAITALSTARAIGDPISKLAAVAKTLATGDLTARAVSEQRDEVGNLADSFNGMAGQLQSMVGNLEQRVAERTEALEQQSLRLRTAAEVARDAASAPNLEALLDQASRLIMDRFGFYHAGIFLLDEKRQYAVLKASPSEAGKIMLERRHRLRVGEQGIVGRVAATGQPRIALDTGVDSVYFNNPLLPNTHSEMALPLKTSEGTIGVVDIQSDQPEAFTQDDIAIVQVMADQLATAIQRTNLLQQVQAQLGQLEQTYQGFTEQTWSSFSSAGRPYIGYKFDNVRLDSIRATADTGRLIAGTVAEAESAEADGPQSLHVPIRLRGQVIGVVDLRFQSRNVPEATRLMIQQIADRLATALENARLLEVSMRQANKERAISEITTKISSSVNMRNVLQTAVEELGRAIPGSEVMIQFRPDTGI
jgi:GAF domain-containing protein/HAMP domain-containing protein